jgi:formamidopyrimidine-DNA glycosylase
VERKGKNIVVRLNGGYAIRVHLRMTGKLSVIPDARLRPATARVIFTLDGGQVLVFDDARVLGTVHLHTDGELDAKLATIGVDPLERQFTLQFVTEAARRSRRPAKLFLMDQHPIAGIGNIYAAESLFRARIHPLRLINTVRAPMLNALHRAIRDVIKEALRVSVKAYREPGYFQADALRGVRARRTTLPELRRGDSAHLAGRTVELFLWALSAASPRPLRYNRTGLGVLFRRGNPGLLFSHC